MMVAFLRLSSIFEQTHPDKLRDMKASVCADLGHCDSYSRHIAYISEGHVSTFTSGAPSGIRHTHTKLATAKINSKKPFLTDPS